MNSSLQLIDSLQKQVESCERQLHVLREKLAKAKHQHQLRQEPEQPLANGTSTTPSNNPDKITGGSRRNSYAASLRECGGLTASSSVWSLGKSEYKRYGRQLIMPEIGLKGQLSLKNAAVLIIGIGGLGCPAAAYLAGAGIGTLGLIDGDIVEESNLHRQILHATPNIGMAKVDSAMAAIRSVNPNVATVPYYDRLTPEIAISTIQPYDVVLDCTDTPASRYLISDACVLLGKPLVSASALRIDGQLMVLNNPPLLPGNPKGGPCYRCIFPKPPPPESVVSCGDGGILGPVVGVMGVLQALEAIKVLTRSVHDREDPATLDAPTLLIFSAYANPMFRTIRLRTRKLNCTVCSARSTITLDSLNTGSLDYAQFCGSINPVNLSKSDERVSAVEYARLRPDTLALARPISSDREHILIDVREKVQFELCNLANSVNVPFSTITSVRGPLQDSSDLEGGTRGTIPWVEALQVHPERPIFVICRLGNDSQVTVAKMKELGLDYGGKRWIGDIKGGLRAWREDVDRDLPDY